MTINILSCQCGSVTIPQRYVFSFMTFLGLVLSYSNRVCIHMAISEMVIPVKHNETRSSAGEVCPNPRNEARVTKGGTLKWDTKEQGLILSSFFFGYFITHMPGGILSDRTGGKHIFCGGAAITSILSLLCPLSTATGHWIWLVILRILMGLVQGPLFPSMTTLMAKWIPANERSTLGSFIITGAHIGTIAGNYVSSVLIAYLDSWSIVFYFWGILGLVWYVFYVMLCYSEPANHPFITLEEATMIEGSLGKKEKLPVPWKAIFTDISVWALIIGSVGHDMIFFLILVQLPKYMADVLKYNIRENGMLSSAPYVGLWICSTISGYIADKVITAGKVSVLTARRVLTAIGHGGPAVCVVLASYMGCNRAAAATMFVLTLVTMGPFYPGMRVNTLDISKNFAGTIMAVSNGAGALTFIPIPCIIGIIAEEHSVEQWRLIFWVLFVILMVTTIFFLIWASGERAEWDKGPNE